MKTNYEVSHYANSCIVLLLPLSLSLSHAQIFSFALNSYFFLYGKCISHSRKSTGKTIILLCSDLGLHVMTRKVVMTASLRRRQKQTL
jgi:hypothetical protein